MSMFITLPNGLPALWHGSVLRVLGVLPGDPKRRRALPKISTVVPDLPKSEWFATNRRPAFDRPRFVLNQQSHGSCCGFGSVGGLMKARAIKGQTYQRLSGAFVYSKINGGQDSGAVIHDSLDALTQFGTCLESEAAWDAIYPNRIPASASTTAQRFKAAKAYVADTWSQFLTGLMFGYVAVNAVMVGNNFTNLDADGIVGFDAGPGNHCVHQYDVIKTARDWASWGDNSWGTSFGQAGGFGLYEKHWESVQQDCYLLEVPSEDPQDNTNPPAVG